jgi:hypothetical protein
MLSKFSVPGYLSDATMMVECALVMFLTFVETIIQQLQSAKQGVHGLDK